MEPIYVYIHENNDSSNLQDGVIEYRHLIWSNIYIIMVESFQISNLIFFKFPFLILLMLIVISIICKSI